jgi:uncharacterized peroxidase-related enzyme
VSDAEARQPRRIGWVDTVAPDAATGVLKQAYDWQSARLGEPTEYTQLGSLQPDLVLERLRLYKVVEGITSGLTAVETRLVSYLTSVLNQTPHCASGARIQLRDLAIADQLIDAIVADPLHPDTGDPRLDAIAAYTATLTTSPGSVSEADIERLRTVGLADADIVALNNLSAYYCYTNRVATGLGLRTEVPPQHAHHAAPR